MSRLLMLLVIIALGLIASAVFRNPESLLTPAHLTDAHADLKDDCFACHRAFFGTPAKKCTACHKPEDVGLRSTQGAPIANDKAAFHQELSSTDCAACHTEHQGRDSGPSLRSFSHDMLKESARTSCHDCHQAPSDELHSDKQQSGCGSCHAVSGWSPSDFDHSEYFSFDRDHRASCSTCHEPPGFATFTCYSCHEHSPRNVRREHREEGIADFENCVECHRNADEDDAKRRFRKQSYRNHDDDD